MHGEGTSHTGTERISGPILVPLVVAVALLLASMAYGVSWLVTHENEARMDRTLRQAEALFQLQLEEDGEALDIALHGIVHDPNYAAPLRAGDRDRLRAMVAPLFDHFREDHRITHFYVMAPDRVVLLRAHDSSLFGDRIDRLTMMQAQRTGSGAWGLELGPLGTLTLRSVMPYQDGGKVLGYFELGEEIGHIIDRVHRILGTDIMVLLDKRRLTRDGWESGQRLFHWPLDWDRLTNVAIAGATMASLPAPLVQRLSTAAADGSMPAGDVLAEGRTLHLAAMAIRDASGARVGSLVVVADLTALHAKSHMLISGVSLVCLALGAVLLVLFRRIVGRVERRIGTAMGSLARSNADLERLAYVACHDLQGAVDGLAESAEMLATRHRAGLDGDGPQLLGSVLSGTYRVREIVETLEDYLDLDINARKEPVALDAVVAAAMEKLNPALGGCEVAIDPLPVLSARPVPLARAVLRLMEAALDHPAPDHPRRLQIAAAEADGWWRIAFSDDGNGDSPARRDAIAEARMVAELHGGELLNSAVAEGGRTVTLVLPAAQAEPETKA